jgi:Alanine racemase
MYRKTYIEVDLDNLSNNIKSIKENYNNYEYYIGVVKGNGYGHGSYIANTLIKSGINYLAVSSLEEAINIRKYNKEIPILCLEIVDLDYINEVIKHDVTITVSSLVYLDKLVSLNEENKIKIHLKINAGFNRLGFKNKEEIKEAFKKIKEPLILEGIYAHFNTLGISDPYYDREVDTFKELTSEIDLKQIKIVHLGRSVSLINHPKLDFANGIRVGIMMYGYNMSPRKNNSLKGKIRNIKANMRIKKYNISKTTLVCKANLSTCFSLYSEVMEIQKIKAGETVGYGLSYKAKEEEYIAIAPIGYADGLNKKNEGRNVFINGKKCPIIGSINMGMIQIKVDKETKVGDKIEIFGENIKVLEVAKYLGTTPYEVLCMLDDKLPKAYRQNKEIIFVEK